MAGELRLVFDDKDVHGLVGKKLHVLSARAKLRLT